MKLKLSIILLIAGFAMVSITSMTCNKPVVLEFKTKMDPIFIDVPDTAATSLLFMYAKKAVAFKLDSTCKANSIPIDKIQSLKVDYCNMSVVSTNGQPGGNFDVFESVEALVNANATPTNTIRIGSKNPNIGNTTLSLDVDKTVDLLPTIKTENIDFVSKGKLRALKIQPMRLQIDLGLNIGYKLN